MFKTFVALLSGHTS